MWHKMDTTPMCFERHDSSHQFFTTHDACTTDSSLPWAFHCSGVVDVLAESDALVQALMDEGSDVDVTRKSHQPRN